MPRLGVNIDHVATLRQQRRGIYPDPVSAARIALDAGADAIVAHLREDRRHIQDRDIFALRKTIAKKFNLEMSIAPGIVKIACKVRPDQATFVPEKRRELTTEGGLDVIRNFAKVKSALKKLEARGIKVSLFIDPEKTQINAAKKSGAKIIELHTGRYADAKNKRERELYFKEIKCSAIYAKGQGLEVFAGHGLDYCNTKRIAGIKEIEELNIGYSIICRALFIGLKRAVKEMRAKAK